jgi:hypothetical protein
MKILGKIIVFGNLVTNFGLLVYVLKEIIHNKDSNSFILSLFLAIGFISYNSFKKAYKEELFNTDIDYGKERI